MGAVSIHITFPSRDEALAVGRRLLEDRLVACVNVIGDAQSLYWWNDQIEESAEVVMLAKTRDDLVPDLVGRVRALHSYACPCVVATPIEGGNSDYLDWIDRETRRPG
ncbi:MAG: divalent-cation tolerance protein CutA [Alphaproteobacteria bacterium]|nr:divalent-cation tolerance protein CutA [Alphaproteobacteria bacterium]